MAKFDGSISHRLDQFYGYDGDGENGAEVGVKEFRNTKLNDAFYIKCKSIIICLNSLNKNMN